jgi:hypothetical protein
MPLEHSSSAAALRDNMRTLHSEIGRSPHVQSRAQAIAIGLETQRRARAAGHADGGGVIPLARQVGGPINPAMLRPPMPGMAPPGNVMPMGVAGPANMPFMRPPGRAVGGFNIAKGPNLSPPNYFERGEARDMTHGPILGSLPGRSDKRVTNVPSSSYILPAHHIAAMGDGNSMAGLRLANSIFGLNGPYGVGFPKMAHGPGAPKPPRSMAGVGLASGGYAYSEGGAREYHDHTPVPVALSDGEFAVHPLVVRNIGNGSVENGHKILDALVMHTRKKEIEKMKRLPEPVKR